MGSNIVVFNALQTSLSGGIGRYSYELSKSIYLKKALDLKIVVRKEDLSLFNFANKEDLIIAENIKNSIDRNRYEQFILPKLVNKKYPNAVIHYPDSMAPFICRNKIIITVHDLAFKSLKSEFTNKTIIWKRIATKFSVKKAKYIITITNFTKNEIKKHYKQHIANKIQVIFNGFNKFSDDKINESNINKDILDLKKSNYILTVSTISPRKNIDGLIKAFNEIKNKNQYKLVVVGKNGWMFEKVYDEAEKLGIKDKILFTGKINDDELKYLYKHANIFVYPSFYEGFGLPPLEAMSFNVPCVVSNKTSIPEVVGNAAITVNPNNYNEIAKQIEKFINSDNLRMEYIKKGNKRLSKFSWEKCAEETIDLYKKTLVK
mgnify:FL=1